MSKNKLLLNIYRMDDIRSCLVLKGTGKPVKVLKLIHVLAFAANMKQLSMALDAGAKKEATYHLHSTDGRQWQLICRFVQDMLRMELRLGQKPRFSWNGTVKEFGLAIDRLIIRLPRFF